MVVVVADREGVVEIAGRDIPISATAPEHRALEELVGEQFQRRDRAISLLGIEVDPLVPGDLGGMKGRREGVLGMMAVVAARFLGESVRPGRRPAPEGRHVATVSGDRPCGLRVGGEIKVGRAATAQALDREREEPLVFTEDGDVHQGVDLGEIDVAIPGAHSLKRRHEGCREHSLHPHPVDRLPVGVIAEKLGRRSEQGADPAGDEEILPLCRHIASKRLPPHIQDRDRPSGRRLVVGGRPDQRVGIRLSGMLLLVRLAGRCRVKPSLHGQAAELAEDTRPGLLPRGNPLPDEVELGLTDDAPRMNEGVGLGRRGRRSKSEDGHHGRGSHRHHEGQGHRPGPGRVLRA